MVHLLFKDTTQSECKAIASAEAMRSDIMNENVLCDVWTEKYRPRLLNEIVGQREVVQRIQSLLAKNSLPHCMFSGPAGIGKTTCALAISREIWKDSWRGNFLELNASVTPDTPILVRINEKIKRTNFAELDKIYFSKDEDKVLTTDLEVLSLDKTYKTKFLKANYLFRHKKSKIARIKYEGGFIKTSLDHSLIVIAQNGKLISKTAEELRPGDFLITFKTNMEGTRKSLDLEDFRPRSFSALRSGLQRNPKIKVDIKNLELNNHFAWTMGMYLAEGCTSIGNTSGQTIFVVGYPQEEQSAGRLEDIFTDLGMSVRKSKGKSGFNRERESSLQVRVLNTQISKFFKENFYDSFGHKAPNKRVPYFIFDLPIKYRHDFLKGYFDGDGSGDWNSVARFSSVSQECLTDVAWLGRLSGLETSCFQMESRIIRENPKFSYVKSELLPASLAQRILKEFNIEKTYLLRHSLYHKKSRRVSKHIFSELIAGLELRNTPFLTNIRNLLDSDISVVEIKSIEIEDYKDYVYDVSVPESQMFWGGTVPVLLHNSDERGIDTIRVKIKDFARTIPIAGGFKIVYLDEADSLTKDAQHALRRIMETFSSTCRFILACNFPSRIITPIQSRCATFRFSPIGREDVINYLKKVADSEALEYDMDALEALYVVCEGDMRKSINLLQSAAFDGHITKEKILGLARRDPEKIRQMISLAEEGSFKESRAVLGRLLAEIPGEDIVREVHKFIVETKTDSHKFLDLFERVAETEWRITEGADAKIQLEALLAWMSVEKE